MKRFWIASISKEHTTLGVSGSFIQVCHGKKAPLKRMTKGDYILVYSSKISMKGEEKFQKFTAIGQVVGDEVYPFQMTENFTPFRRNVLFFDCVDCPIFPLLNDLDFIENKKMWGYPFRYGLLEIQEKDFNFIASKMMTDEAKRQYI